MKRSSLVALLSAGLLAVVASPALAAKTTTPATNQATAGCAGP